MSALGTYSRSLSLSLLSTIPYNYFVTMVSMVSKWSVRGKARVNREGQWRGTETISHTNYTSVLH